MVLVGTGRLDTLIPALPPKHKGRATRNYRLCALNHSIMCIELVQGALMLSVVGTMWQCIKQWWWFLNKWVSMLKITAAMLHVYSLLISIHVHVYVKSTCVYNNVCMYAGVVCYVTVCTIM